MDQKSKLTLLLVAAFTLAAGPRTASGQEPNESGWYETAHDVESAWHPEKIYIVWPELEMEFRLPHEQDQSGVANLLFRERKSGEIRLLDTLREGVRHYNHFEPGDYDVILLYNNGKYITYDGLTLSKGMKRSFDMAAKPIRAADQISRRGLTMRKFTDVIGERTLVRNYTPAASEKVSGYLFASDTGNALSGVVVRQDNSSDGKLAYSSQEGYFEFPQDENATAPTLDIQKAGYRASKIESGSRVGYFIVMENHPEELEMIGADRGPAEQ